MKLEVGDVIKLSDGLDYAIIQKLQSNKVVYLYLITTSKPLQTAIVKEKIDDNQIILETVTDEEELDYVLYRIGQLA